MEERMVLYADAGKVFTDGSIFGKVIYLAQGCPADAYYQITEAEAELMLSAPEATMADYRAALSEMGVAL